MTSPDAQSDAPALYEVFLELIGRWTTETIAAEVVARSGADVDMTEFLALSVIARTETILAGELAGPMRMTPSNVSKVLARLERKQLVTRTPSSSDRRAVQVALTPAGARVARGLRRAGETMIGELLDGWDARDARQLTALLDRLLNDVRDRQFPDEGSG